MRVFVDNPFAHPVIPSLTKSGPESGIFAYIIINQ